MAARAGDVFVGRVRELVLLERSLDQTRAGEGSTVLVAGEAGIGKTRLAAEVARRAGDAGFEVLLGRSIDLVGTELPYQPFVDAVRPVGESSRLDARAAGSQLQVFEESLALLIERATAAPVLLTLEDLHWADASTLDLVVFLAHNLRDRSVLLLATYRADEPSSADRMHRLAEGVRRAASGLVLDLGPLPDEEVAALLAARSDDHLPAGLSDTIIDRCEGNPFFAEELLAAASDLDGHLPPGLRNLLLRRVAKLDPPTQELLRLAAAAGRDVAYPLLRAAARLPEHDVRESLRQAIEHGLLVAEPVGPRWPAPQASPAGPRWPAPQTSPVGPRWPAPQASPVAGTFRFRHALLAEAVYATILPGEREELHARLAEELARSLAAPPAELAPHWAVAGRTREALVASVEAADQAQAVFGLAEALAHLERALALWDTVPDAHQLVKVDLADLCSRAAGLANQVGADPHAVELATRAVELVGLQDPHRAARLHVLLGELLLDARHDAGGLAETERLFRHAIHIVPADPPSPERAWALGSLAGALMVAGRHAESLPIGEQALQLARQVGAREGEVRALTVRGADRAYLGRVEDGLVDLRNALRLADEIGDHWGLERTYANLTDVLTMLGRPGESARLGRAGLEVLYGYGISSPVLMANTIEALLALGDWTEADRLSSAALRRVTANLRHMFHVLRADLEVGRGDFGAARTHLDAALSTLPEDRWKGAYDAVRAELALWEHRWVDAGQAARDALAVAPSTHASLRVGFCAKWLRAHAELAALARIRRDTGAVSDSCDRAGELIAVARQAADASVATPNVEGWLALAEAEHGRVLGAPSPQPWSAAAAAWDRAERPPLAAYCRWREADALVTAGAARTEASGPLHQAYATAVRIGAIPLQRALELLAQRARLEVTPPEPGPVSGARPFEEALGLTAREAEVLDLIARGRTNSEIAAALVISVRTASVHVSHILRKLGVPNRLEAAAIVHRLSRP